MELKQRVIKAHTGGDSNLHRGQITERWKWDAIQCFCSTVCHELRVQVKYESRTVQRRAQWKTRLFKDSKEKQNNKKAVANTQDQLSSTTTIWFYKILS